MHLGMILLIAIGCGLLGCATAQSRRTTSWCTQEEAVRRATAKFVDEGFRKEYLVDEVYVIDLRQYEAWIVVFPKRDAATVKPTTGRIRVSKATCEAEWQPGA
jgi:hypothetical protein